MNTSKIEKLIARQRALGAAIHAEKRLSRQRKQKTIYSILKRLGLLDVTDDQMENALRVYTSGRNTTGNEGEQP